MLIPSLSHSHSDNDVYDKLMEMGYPQSISSIASKNNQNINAAVAWIMTNNDNQQNNHQHNIHNPKEKEQRSQELGSGSTTHESMSQLYTLYR